MLWFHQMPLLLAGFRMFRIDKDGSVVPPNLIRAGGLAAILEAALFVIVDLIDLLFSGASVRRGAWCYTRARREELL
jgi:hypothetical protein